MDEVKPSDLSLSFLREFMELPISYFQPGAQIKYRKEHSLTYVNTDPLIMPTSTSTKMFRLMKELAIYVSHKYPVLKLLNCKKNRGRKQH